MTITNGAITVTESVSVLNVTPATVAFGEQEQSTTSAASNVTIANTGTDGIDLEVTALNFSVGVFAASGGTCGSLPFSLSDGESCTVGVTFSPTADDPYTGTLSVTSDADTVTNNSVTLSGTGTPGPAGALTITPDTFDFEEVLTNSGTSTQVFTVTNTGATGSSVDIDSITAAAPFSIVSTGNTCATADLAYDETCTVSVTFTPTADGEVTGTLTVTGTDGNDDTKEDTSALSGEGVTKSIYTSDPAAGASDSEVVGPEGSNDFTITLGNDGNADYTYSAALTSTSASVFSVTAGASGTVAGGESATVTVNCTLEDTETYEGSVVITVGDDEYTYNYECVGLPPLPVPVDNKWALVLLALMMLMAASFGFRFMARQ